MKGQDKVVIYLTSVQLQEKNEAVLEDYIQAIAKEDATAFEALYEQTRTAVYGFALSVLKNTHDAEDVLQESFVRIHYGAKDYTPTGKPMAWIMTITKNLCMRKFRERKNLSDLPQEDWELYIEANERMSVDDKLVIEQVMKTLSDEERQIVVLHALSGFKHREIAKMLDLPLATVLSKYHRALKKLKDHL